MKVKQAVSVEVDWLMMPRELWLIVLCWLCYECGFLAALANFQGVCRLLRDVGFDIPVFAHNTGRRCPVSAVYIARLRCLQALALKQYTDLDRESQLQLAVELQPLPVSLHELNLCGFDVSNLQFERLSNLQRLVLDRCILPAKFPAMQSLKDLTLADLPCDGWALDNLTTLERLQLADSLQRTPVCIPLLTAVTHLTLDDCEIAGLAAWTQLHSLYVREGDCFEESDIKHLTNLTALETKRTDLSAATLSALPKLQRLRVDDKIALPLRRLDELCPSLVKLDLICYDHADCTLLPSMDHLIELSVDKTAVWNIGLFDKCTSLQLLHIWDFYDDSVTTLRRPQKIKYAATYDLLAMADL